MNKTPRRTLVHNIHPKDLLLLHMKLLVNIFDT